MTAPLFRHVRRVRYADCTLGNHVYHARYLEWLDEARVEFFRSLGIPLRRLQETGALFVVVEYHLHYRSLARYDDALTIEVRPAGRTRVRLALSYEVLNPLGEPVLEASATYACTDPDGKPTRVPKELAAALDPWLAPSEASGAGSSRPG